MSNVREAARLGTAAAGHRMAVIGGAAAGYCDIENANRAAVLDAKADELLAPKEPVVFTRAGEVVPRNNELLHPDTARTARIPGMADVEASEERTRLLDTAGPGVLATGLALAEETEAGDGIQKMLTHQMALMHEKIFELMKASDKQRDAIEQTRLINASMRMMTTFQQAALTLQRLKAGGEQRVVVKHLHIAQAVIGNVTTGGGRGSRGKKDEIPCALD